MTDNSERQTDGSIGAELRRLVEGERYRITKPGAKLVADVRTGPYSWTSETYSLEPEDVVTYIGKLPGLGHDNVPQDSFESPEGDTGKFHPQSWGSADTSFLESVEENGEQNGERGDDVEGSGVIR